MTKNKIWQKTKRKAKKAKPIKQQPKKKPVKQAGKKDDPQVSKYQSVDCLKGQRKYKRYPIVSKKNLKWSILLFVSCLTTGAVYSTLPLTQSKYALRS